MGQHREKMLHPNKWYVYQYTEGSQNLGEASQARAPGQTKVPPVLLQIPQRDLSDKV